MAKLYGEIAAKALLTLDKSFARANGQPLDASEVYYSLQAAKDYAATAQAYIGQKIVVIENGVVSHYSVEDTAGNLKELGSKPVADGTTVAIGADGKITLANIAEANKTGTYNAVLVNGTLTWVKPSETTVEGLSDLIQALTGRMDTAEADIDALQAAVGVAAKEAVGEEGAEDYEPAVPATGLHKAIADEVARAEAAEKALGERIDGIDFVDGDELAEAIESVEAKIPTNNNQLENGAGYQTASDVSSAITTAIANKADKGTTLAEYGITDAYTKTEADSALQDAIKDFATTEYVDTEIEAIEEAISKLNHFTTKIVTSTDEVTEEGILYLIKDESVAGVDKYNEYLFVGGEAILIGDTTTDLSDYYNKEAIDGKVETINGAIADEVEAREALAEEVEALKAIDNATQEELDAYKTEVTSAIATAKSEAIADAEGKIATAKQEAIDAAATAAAGIYATKTAFGELETAIDGRLDALEAYDHTIYATKEELNAHDTAAAAKYATKDELAPVKQTADNAAAKVETLEDKIEEITSVGGEPNTIDYIKVNGTILEVEKDAEGKSTKTVNVVVPTKVSDLTDDTGFDARITAAQAQADKGVNDASAAHTAATQAQNEVDALEEVVGGHTTKITNLETSVQGHTDRLLALESDNTTNKSDITALKASVLANAEALGGKANASDLQNAVSKIGANETAIKALNETTIPGLNTEIGKKANAADVYTKTQVGTIAEGKTLVDMINDAKGEATYDDTAIKALIKGNTDAIAILNGDAETDGSVLKVARAEAKAEVAAIVGAAPETMDTLEEVAKWIENDETGAAAMAKRITANETAIAAINHAETGILATANAYADALFAGIPAATAETLGLVKVDNTTIKVDEAGTIAVKAVSTDLLTQGAQELVLYGGTAATGVASN